MAREHAILRKALANIHIDTLKEANKFFHLVEMIEPGVPWEEFDPKDLWQAIVEAIMTKEKA